MATYPVKMLKDEEGKPFVPLISIDSIKEVGGETLEQQLDKKLETTNLIAGTQIALEVEGNNVIISNSAEGTKLINNLDQTTVGVGALDAAQGKVLKESIPEVINNLTTIDSKKALSAHQGYVLAGRSVPVGGGTGQVLMKSADDDYSLTWGDAADPNAIVGDGSIKKIVELTYEEYNQLDDANLIDETTEYHISNWSESGYNEIRADQILFGDNSNVQEKLNNIDLINDGQNTRLDIAENNIDTMVGTINSLSQTVSSHTSHINSYTPCKIAISGSGKGTAGEVIDHLGEQVPGLDVTYMRIAANTVANSIGTYMNKNSNISTGGPNFQVFVAGVDNLYTALITNYSGSYIVLLRRINSYYYGTYIGV